MAKAQPITPGVSVISKKQLGTLVAEAARLHLNLSPSQARVHIAELADQLSKALSDPKGSGIPLLDQAPLRDKDLSSALRKPLIDGLERTRGAARGIRGTLPVDKGGDPDPYYRKFVSLAQNIYIDAGGTGVGAYKSTHDDQGSAGKLIDLINAAIRLGPGDSYLKGKTATRKVIERLKERT
jgi:hypothetical protein